MTDTESVHCGCEKCQDVNVSNASNGIIQLVLCDTNDIDGFEEAMAFIREDLEQRGRLDSERDQP